MTTIKTKYQGDLRTVSEHLKSKMELITDVPTDNQGKGEAFSPTDLLATSLSTCILTIMGIKARKLKVNIDGADASVTKIMSSKPRKVKEVIVELSIPAQNLDQKTKNLLEEAGRNCPVALSLSKDLKQSIKFNYF